ncbi:MAG: recombinase [Pseudomonadota bacterium]
MPILRFMTGMKSSRSPVPILWLLPIESLSMPNPKDLIPLPQQPRPPHTPRLPADMPDAVIGRGLADANHHPGYAAAKSGERQAALRLAQDLVSDDMVNRVRALIGDRTALLCPVISVEKTGRNKIPLAVAAVLGRLLGLMSNQDIVQVNQPHRTGLSGLDRLFALPVFDGAVEADRAYLLIDDAITQGATFAALSAHIRANGGRVLGAVALTGKQYSAKLALQQATLEDLRGKYGDLEQNFRRETGHGFDDLTESEARYITKLKHADEFRDRLLAQRG